VNRAYALLNIKAVDPDLREITGLATSVTADLMDDVVEPRGAQFQLPIPLLWQHNSREPIGEVYAAKVTDEGIEIKARLAQTDEPGKLKDRLDEAWQSIKLGLVKGLSIGFKALEAPYDKTTGGYHFLKWLWLELSAVTIPANTDAAILAIKAASGRHTPGVSGLPVVQAVKAASPMKTITEQISSFENTRAAKAARQAEIMTKASEENVTLDDAQAEEYETLKTELKAVDDHLVRLHDMETTNKAAAKPVNGDDPAKASASRGHVITVKNQIPPGITFARYAICLAAAKGNTHQALEIAKTRYPDQGDIHTVLKAAVSAGTTTDATWAEPLVNYQNFMGDFVEFLRPQTIIGKFGTGGIPSLRRVPFNIRIPGQTTGGAGYWVGEGQGKPVTKFDFNSVTLRWAKVANIAVLTQELVRFSNPSAEALVRDALAAALVERLDIDFVDPLKAEVVDTSPASITNGVVGINSTGNDIAAIRADIKLLMAPFIAANITPATGVWIMSATRALALSLMTNALGQPEFPGVGMNGGTFLGMPVIVSQYVVNSGSPTLDIVVLVNASDIYLADDGQVVIDVSNEASLQMDTAPTNASGDVSSPSAPVPTTLVSLWQTNSIGLKAERFITWKRRRNAAVQFLYDVHWA
jgi:HK97 family phage major capsid protein/HK97 family phage prohead protease